MKQELDEALCRDFPLLYRDRNGDPRRTCMVYGFPGDGWEPIIRRLSEKLEPAIAALPEEQREACRAAQVKEKFGLLRYYLDGCTPEMWDWIREAEDESARTCEDCGAPGKRNGRGWIRTTCPEHTK